MADTSPSIDGANYNAARSFEFAFNVAGGAVVSKSLIQGAYELIATVDCLVRTDGTDPTALPSTQPVSPTAPNATVKVLAGVPKPLDMNADGTIKAIGWSAAGGTLTINGPLLHSKNR
jgi:hypothetical protein